MYRFVLLCFKHWIAMYPATMWISSEPIAIRLRNYSTTNSCPSVARLHTAKKCFCTDGKKITCFTCTASIYKLRKLPKKVNTQLDILLSVCKRFCLYKSKTVTLPPLSTIKQMYKCVLHFLTHYPSVKPLQRFIAVLYTWYLSKDTVWHSLRVPNVFVHSNAKTVTLPLQPTIKQMYQCV